MNTYLDEHSTIGEMSYNHISLLLQPMLNLLTSLGNGFGEMEIAAALRK